MTVTENASNPNRPKRVRTDPTAALPRQGQQTSRNPESPRTIAENWISSHVATLHPQVSSIVQQYGNQFISLKAQEHNKSYQIERMEKDTEFIPRSARIKFEYSMSEEARATPAFQQLLAQTNTEITQFQQTLKQGIIQATKIELAAHQQKLQTLTIRAIFDITKSFLIVQQNGKDLHNLPMIATLKETLSSCHEKLILHTSFSDRNGLYNAFNTFHNTTITPVGTTATDHSDSLALGMLGLAQITAQAHQDNYEAENAANTHQAISATLLAIFHSSWDEYLKQYTKNSVTTQLKKFETEIFCGNATSEAATMIDAEPAVNQATISKLISDATTKRTKHLEKAISKLELQINTISKNSAPRGAAYPSRQQNSKRNPNSVAASDNAGRYARKNQKPKPRKHAETKKKKESKKDTPRPRTPSRRRSN